MAEADTTPDSRTECTFQEEYRNSWLTILIDEIRLECYEGLL